jgi:hypothetical protein
MCTHTMHDLFALPTQADREKARGLVERRHGRPRWPPGRRDARPHLTQVVRLSNAERALLSRWNEPPAWDAETGEEATPPGQGHFLIKVAGKPGIPFRVELTDAEREQNEATVADPLPYTAAPGGMFPDVRGDGL